MKEEKGIRMKEIKEYQTKTHKDEKKKCEI